MPDRPTISISIMGHNEGHLLKNALESVQWADEVIYVDCDSKDDSLEIAKKYTPLVFSRPNLLNLNVNKFFGIEKATSEWVFFLDCDEVISQELKQEILETIATHPKENGYWLPRKNYYFGQWLKYGNKYPDPQLRLFRAGKARFPLVHQHEKLVVDGQVGNLRTPMDHYTIYSVSQLISTLNFRSDCDALRLLNAGLVPSRWGFFNHVFYRPWKRFINYYFKRRGYKDGMAGFIAFFFYALEFPMTYLKAWHWYTYPEEKPEWEDQDF